MPVSPDVLRLHLDYTAWASVRLLECAAALPEDQLVRDFQTADRSVLDTLVHVFAADRIWLQRVQGTPQSTFITPEDRSLTTLQREWPAIHKRWKEWALPLTEASVESVLAYSDLKGNPWKQPLWQIVLHVVNHGTHHRGQVSGFLRSMGHTPPPLDLIAFYRGL